ncbi:tetratricopeptide repeat protein [Myxococcota bacterium]|nr:tetratricopeptide repeat protein [Myxococcota bacterium]
MRPPILQRDGEEGPVDLLELEEDVRRGAVRGDARLWHPPWTGEGFRRVDELPALAEALQAPGARFVAQLHAPGRTWGAIALTVLLMGAALAQGIASALGGSGLGNVDAQVAKGALGWDGALLEGRWWSTWTAHVLHWPRAPIVHALANFPFLAYCGYRVERAWGWTGLLRVLGATVAVSSTAVLLLSGPPVLGSSMLAFGLLGAQIAIGFRMGDHLPPGLTGRYGWGSLRAVLLIMAVHKGVELALAGHTGLAQGVSHLGHASGLLGGALGVLVGAPAALRPSALGRRARRTDLAVAALGLAVPVLVSITLPLAPRLAGSPWRPVQVEEAGLHLSLPWRMVEQPVAVSGLRGWRGDPNSQGALFVDRALHRSFEARAAFDGGDWWGGRLGGVAVPLPAPAPLAPGWRALSWRVDGEARWTVVEHQREEGLYVVRVAWVVPGGAPTAARERLYRAALATLRIDEPPDLVAQRERFARQPEAPARAYDLAHELYVSGRFSEADALLAGLLSRDDGWQWDAARTRLRVFEVHPDTGAGVDPGWLVPLLEQAPPGDLALLEPGITWLVSEGACAPAEIALARWASRAGAAEAPVAEALARADAAWQARCAP